MPAEIQPHDSPQMQREIMISYCERQAGIRSEARQRISQNMTDTEAKIMWYNADQQLDKLLVYLFELTNSAELATK